MVLGEDYQNSGHLCKWLYWGIWNTSPTGWYSIISGYKWLLDPIDRSPTAQFALARFNIAKYSFCFWRMCLGRRLPLDGLMKMGKWECRHRTMYAGHVLTHRTNSPADIRTLMPNTNAGSTMVKGQQQRGFKQQQY